jgi:hypothetical protein
MIFKRLPWGLSDGGNIRSIVPQEDLKVHRSYNSKNSSY